MLEVVAGDQSVEPRRREGERVTGRGDVGLAGPAGGIPDAASLAARRQVDGNEIVARLSRAAADLDDLIAFDLGQHGEPFGMDGVVLGAAGREQTASADGLLQARQRRIGPHAVSIGGLGRFDRKDRSWGPQVMSSMRCNATRAQSAVSASTVMRLGTRPDSISSRTHAR